MKLCLILFLSLFSTIAVGQYTVNSVPNPKESGLLGYVSNPDGILSADEAGTIDNICRQIEEQDSFQVAFVILQSIGSEVPKDFAGQLFNEWKVGHAGRDDGLLVLFVMDQRRIEFETGYGTETILPDYQCVLIQQDYMVPFFRDNEYPEGLKAGAQAIQRDLRGQIVDRHAARSRETEQRDYDLQLEAESRNRTRNLIISLIAWHAIGLSIFMIVLLVVRFRNDPYKKYKAINYFALWIWAVLFPITHIFVVIFARKSRQRYRDMIRFSGKTGEIMRKLSENDEDEYLSRGQITEELVKSVDYDVWITDKSDDVLVLAYRPLFTYSLAATGVLFRQSRPKGLTHSACTGLASAPGQGQVQRRIPPEPCKVAPAQTPPPRRSRGRPCCAPRRGERCRRSRARARPRPRR